MRPQADDPLLKDKLKEFAGTLAISVGFLGLDGNTLQFLNALAHWLSVHGADWIQQQNHQDEYLSTLRDELVKLDIICQRHALSISDSMARNRDLKIIIGKVLAEAPRIAKRGLLVDCYEPNQTREDLNTRIADAVIQAALGDSAQFSDSVTNDVRRILIEIMADMSIGNLPLFNQGMLAVIRNLAETINSRLTAVEHGTAEWAEAKAQHGAALLKRGKRAYGPQSLRYFDSALAHYEQALTVYTRAQHSTEWARLQCRVGDTLGTKAERLVDFQERIEPLGKAALAFQAALEVYKPDEFRLEWAEAHIGQGNVYRLLATMPTNARHETFRDEIFGVFAPKLSMIARDRAEAAIEQALRIFTPNDQPLKWALAQNVRALMFLDLAEQQGIEAETDLLTTAIGIFKKTGSVFCGTCPTDWAQTQSYLGRALLHLGAAQTGATREKTFDEAAKALDEALSETGGDSWPALRAEIQVGLAVVWLDKAMRLDEQRTNLLEAAHTACMDALNIYSLENGPREWMRATLISGEVLCRLALEVMDEKRPESIIGVAALLYGAQEQLENGAKAFAGGEYPAELESAWRLQKGIDEALEAVEEVWREFNVD